MLTVPLSSEVYCQLYLHTIILLLDIFSNETQSIRDNTLRGRASDDIDTV